MANALTVRSASITSLPCGLLLRVIISPTRPRPSNGSPDASRTRSSALALRAASNGPKHRHRGWPTGLLRPLGRFRPRPSPRLLSPGLHRRWRRDDRRRRPTLLRLVAVGDQAGDRFDRPLHPAHRRRRPGSQGQGGGSPPGLAPLCRGVDHLPRRRGLVRANDGRHLRQGARLPQARRRLGRAGPPAGGLDRAGRHHARACPEGRSRRLW